MSDIEDADKVRKLIHERVDGFTPKESKVFTVTRNRILKPEEKATDKLGRGEVQSSEKTCSFCEKTLAQIDKLVEGNGALICRDCLATCSRILDEDDADKS